MPRRPSHCKECGKPRAANRSISKNGLCPKCGIQRMTDQNLQMMHKSGPWWDAHQAKMREMGYLPPAS